MDMYEAYLTRAYGKLNMHLLSLSANSLQAEARGPQHGNAGYHVGGGGVLDFRVKVFSTALQLVHIISFTGLGGLYGHDGLMKLLFYVRETTERVLETC